MCLLAHQACGNLCIDLANANTGCRMPTMNVSLTPELMQLVQSKVASGMYNNASEFIREAIRNVDGNERLLYELKLARLKESLLPGIAEAENGVYAEYAHDQLMDDLDREAG